MIFKIKNTTSSDILHGSTGVNYPSGVYTQVNPSDLRNFTDQQTFTLLGSSSFLFNDTAQDYIDPSLAWSALTGLLAQNVVVQSAPSLTIQSQPAPAPFAAKTIGTKKLYKRVNGVQSAVIVGSTDILFTVPYAWCKITGLELIGAETLDHVSLYILDSTTGTYSTIPNYTLNQFGFNVNPAKDYYNHTSEYDADLYQNMQIKVSYTSISAKTVGINFILNEVK